ncbi:hypothetical protein QYE76_056605 [Lolium multiflorum]|uniref:CCHC-type domain-containing protein n=1 Tax=Lolium multiflorum TaxID=4521 RepID=A0AAD8T1Z1_LOLMU|nr:hypothetical protein QYE76_056605 [Lolium multiflorum]
MTYQWESYQLGPGGDLGFEKELKQLVDYLGHPYPKFFGIPLKAKAGEPPQWDVSTDLRRKLDAPVWETIWLSVKGSTWKEGLDKAMQEAIFRLCGQNEDKIKNTRFIYYPRHDSMGRPMTMPPPQPKMNPYEAPQDFRQYNPQGFGQRPRLSPRTSPVKKKHPPGRVVSPQHLSRCELYQDPLMAPPTRNNSRAQANQIYIEHAKMTDAIKILAMERKALRHQHTKKDYLIARLRVKIASLEQLIPIPNHAPRDKSTVTCYECGVTGHYSNKCPMKAANNAPRTGSNAVPIAQKNKSAVTCYECRTVGHYSNECPKKLAKTAPNDVAPAQLQRRFTARRKFAPNYQNNNHGRYYNMTATEAQEAPQNMPSMFPATSYRPISLRNLTFLKISGRDLFKGEGL